MYSIVIQYQILQKPVDASPLHMFIYVKLELIPHFHFHLQNDVM